MFNTNLIFVRMRNAGGIEVDTPARSASIDC